MYVRIIKSFSTLITAESEETIGTNKNHKTMKKNLKKTTIVLAAATTLFSSCGTILSGGSPKITINGDITEPVTIVTEKETYENVQLPQVVKVKRHKIDGQRIRISSDNYTYNDIVLEKSVNSTTFGNILLGGIPGWIVDLCTNCVSKPSQKHFFIEGKPKH